MFWRDRDRAAASCRLRLAHAGIAAAAIALGAVSAGGEAKAQTAGLERKGDDIFVPETSPLRQRLTVKAIPADDAPRKLVLPAIVEAEPERTASVLPPLSGRLVALKVSLGDSVQHGQVVAVIDSPDLDQAFDDDDKAADAAQLTKTNLKRQEEQLKITAISERDLDQARSDNAQAQAEYTRTQARLRALAAAEGGPRLLSVRAPVSGSVTQLSVAVGNMINDPTQPLMTIADLSEVWVTAMVPEAEISAVAHGQDAEVALDAYPHDVLRGKVAFVSDVIEPDTRRDKLRIAFPNADYKLKPNMFATATLIGPPRNLVVLPASAILMNNDRVTVFIETAPWTFQRRTVTADLQDDGSAAIIAGLSGGEKVVVAGGVLLND